MYTLASASRIEAIGTLGRLTPTRYTLSHPLTSVPYRAPLYSSPLQSTAAAAAALTVAVATNDYHDPSSGSE